MNTIKNNVNTPTPAIPAQGDLFQRSDGYNRTLYILAIVNDNNEYNLIALRDGGRWTRPQSLEDLLIYTKTTFTWIGPRQITIS